MNPFLLDGPSLISFSGGRTSAFMLHEIVQAHGGALPDHVRVAFANTGKEREETLRFVHECGSRWGVRIHWIEWRDANPCFDTVGFNSASRSGEPFAALIVKKQRLPNWKERWCTEFLKVRPLFALAESWGWTSGEYTEIIGLRYDEGMRVMKMLARNDNDGRRCFAPLAKAKVTKPQVMEFWSRQPFDLNLRPWEGNCDLCFMKGRGIRKSIIRDNPACAGWWSDQEGIERGNGRGWFDKRDRVADLVSEVERSPTLFDDGEWGDHDAECGLLCAAE
ncbi:phosphoadenosine phosphosulfate reductase family protein [Rhodopseudomonas sp. BR0C11]|uniref:phosphoadenosine phosphosulfate reductase family protein n=1 Tax=Rhodopseudomonas sp. BR0C11 TaxID=2269370 RepID=UPI0013DF5787|nr:phosphoadenosine phosphosulfate reductase family protein [Rhodopseudomonas sp. BR0C11]NEV75618.1 phosphoadenosine phosphosulfate reductase family protein [Rhodopseudomonas sp. BR0C11]